MWFCPLAPVAIAQSASQQHGEVAYPVCLLRWYRQNASKNDYALREVHLFMRHGMDSTSSTYKPGTGRNFPFGGLGLIEYSSSPSVSEAIRVPRDCISVRITGRTSDK